MRDARVFIALGLYGLPYFCLVLLWYVALAIAWKRFKVVSADVFALALPILAYLFLIYLVEDRQGYNAGFANLATAVAVCLTLPLKGSARVRSASVAIAVVGSLAAIASWWLVPRYKMTWRLF